MRINITDADAVEVTVKGIPCIAYVTHFEAKPGEMGQPYNSYSSDDYNGYEEIDFELYDRKGYRAKWLDPKLDKDEIEMIEDAIIRQFKQQYLDSMAY